MAIKSRIKGSVTNLQTVEDLFLEELNDLYDAEDQIIKALPKMVKAASSVQLKEAFREYLGQTKVQKQRLEDIFTKFGKKPKSTTCEGMKGLLAEGEVFVTAKGNPSVKDAALISAAQKVEHYEIATYGTLRTFAQDLGMGQAASMLQQALDEEMTTDKMLTSLAIQDVNVQARKAG